MKQITVKEASEWACYEAVKLEITLGESYFAGNENYESGVTYRNCHSNKYAKFIGGNTDDTIRKEKVCSDVIREWRVIRYVFSISKIDI